jgi:lyso-ornithine lipid O-acyltransferase
MIRVFYVIFVLFLLTLILFPFQLFAYFLQGLWVKTLPVFWHTCVCRIFGFNIELRNQAHSEKPLLLVSNHISWSDIFILGSLTPLSFIAKSEVKTWPLLGLLARLQGTIFVNRSERHKTGAQTSAIAQRLKQGDSLVLFGEGTTSDGTFILPFKSSLFGAANMALDPNNPLSSVIIQPVCISYVTHYGISLGRYHRPLVGWSGTVGLWSHIMQTIKARSIGVVVTFGEPINYTHLSNRKLVAKKIESLIKKTHENALYGETNRVMSPNNK